MEKDQIFTGNTTIKLAGCSRPPCHFALEVDADGLAEVDVNGTPAAIFDLIPSTSGAVLSKSVSRALLLSPNIEVTPRRLQTDCHEKCETCSRDQDSTACLTCKPPLLFFDTAGGAFQDPPFYLCLRECPFGTNQVGETCVTAITSDWWIFYYWERVGQYDVSES
jgi:hypothetical protein